VLVYNGSSPLGSSPRKRSLIMKTCYFHRYSCQFVLNMY
jgi:hypothetical protein